MPNTWRENYQEALSDLAVPDGLLAQLRQQVVIHHEAGAYRLRDEDRLLLPFIERLRQERPKRRFIAVDGSVRVMLMRYVTSAIADEARRCPATQHQGVRALQQPGAQIEFERTQSCG